MDICNGCGNNAPAFGQLCNDCSKEVVCQNCNCKYKRGQGLQDVNLCPHCLHECLASSPEHQNADHDCDLDDPYETYGFDHQWELYEK